jgi:Rrf2 family protein
MKITAQEEYGLRCLLRLARVYGGPPLASREIAEAENLSLPYASKLLTVLRQAGLIVGDPGPKGGYHLTRPPEQIRLGDVMRILGEPLFEDPGYCEKHAGPETSGPCVHMDGCTLKGLWQTLEQWMRHILDQVTLADLLHGEAPVFRRLRAELPPPETPLLTLNALSRG